MPASEPTDLIREASEALDGITPGPWVAQDYDDYPGDEGCGILGGEGIYQHAFAYTGLGYPWVERAQAEKDAGFIAAAPDLVRRLRDALATALDDNHTLADAYRSEHDRALRLAIRAAGAEDVQAQRDDAREQLRLALIDQANTEAALAEARAQIAADRDAHAAEMLDADEAASETRRILSEQVERAQHEAEVERFKAIDATAELVKARDLMEDLADEIRDLREQLEMREGLLLRAGRDNLRLGRIVEQVQELADTYGYTPNMTSAHHEIADQITCAIEGPALT